jgi:hypothetical protein
MSRIRWAAGLALLAAVAAGCSHHPTGGTTQPTTSAPVSHSTSTAPKPPATAPRPPATAPKPPARVQQGSATVQIAMIGPCHRPADARAIHQDK